MMDCWQSEFDNANDAIQIELLDIQKTYANQSQIDAVLETQTHWETYSKSECAEQVRLRSFSGAAEHLACMTDHAKFRLKYLKYLNCRENGCPLRK